MTRESTPAAAPEGTAARRLPVTVTGLVVLVISLALTAALSVTAYRLNRHAEHRLLDLQVRQTATVLQTSLPAIETPLASAAQAARANHGSARAFRSYMNQFVGAAPAKPFVSSSLWRLGGGSSARLITVVGKPLALARTPGGRRILAGSAHAASVDLIGPLAEGSKQPRLGLAFAAGTKGMFVVYAESALPPGRHVSVQRDSPFADLRFALYVGARARPSKLLETNEKQVPIRGDTVTSTVDFGSSKLTLVAGADRQLGGALSGDLWWIVALGGALLSLLGAYAADRLARGRRLAERLAERSQGELVEQRSIARTVQQALLPEAIAHVPGLLSEARYYPGAEGVDIGGDWYDLLPLPDGRVFFAVGDVSGRGVDAGTTMAALRFATHAFVSEHTEPQVVLERLAGMIDVTRGGQFATVLCGVLDVRGREMVLANAGHLPPLLIADGRGRYVETALGPPLGATVRPSYRAVTVPVPERAMLLSFTDGLVERPGKTLDESLDELCATLDATRSLDQVFDRLVNGLVGDSTDDVAILGVQWVE